MSDRFRFDDAFYPVPPSAVDANPAETIKGLLFRIGRLEHSLEEDTQQARADLSEAMLHLLTLSDDVTNIVERFGVSTKAQDATLVGYVVALGKKLHQVLKYYQIEAVNTLGKSVNPETSDVAGTEVRTNVPPDTVLREVQIGYTWPHGVLRRARVIVSAKVATAPTDGAAQSGSMDGPSSASTLRGATGVIGSRTSI
ncbi:MAG: nucleotide exchange factor GrpE [Anaerolineae bacterium]